MMVFDDVLVNEINTTPGSLAYYLFEDKILDFLRQYPARYYAIRDKSNLGGTFKLKVLYNKVLEEIREYNALSKI